MLQKANAIKIISLLINISYLIFTIILFGGLGKASAATLTYAGSTNKLVMILSYDQHKQSYLSKYRLVGEKNKILNKGQFHGCTYGGTIKHIADYLQNYMKLIAVVQIKNGFVIYYVKGCGAQSIWQLDVITPACTASAPATDDNGNYINIGNDPDKISFGYLEGFGAARRVVRTYLTVDNKNIIHQSTLKLPKKYPKPNIICQS